MLKPVAAIPTKRKRQLITIINLVASLTVHNKTIIFGMVIIDIFCYLEKLKIWCFISYSTIKNYTKA